MEKIKGMTFGYWSAPEVLLSSSAKNSLNELMALNGLHWLFQRYKKVLGLQGFLWIILCVPQTMILSRQLNMHMILV